MLRKKAAEELKKEQERKAAERRKVGFKQRFVFLSKVSFIEFDSSCIQESKFSV